MPIPQSYHASFGLPWLTQLSDGAKRSRRHSSHLDASLVVEDEAIDELSGCSVVGAIQNGKKIVIATIAATIVTMLSGSPTRTKSI